VSSIDQVNDHVRLLRLQPVKGEPPIQVRWRRAIRVNVGSIQGLYISRVGDEMKPPTPVPFAGQLRNGPLHSRLFLSCILSLSICSTRLQAQFLPGQFLDVHIPSLPHAGGFSITSPPSQLAGPAPYLELAVQHAASNPHAVFLSRPARELLSTELRVRVGGSFVWPPVTSPAGVRRAVFVAGGIGINPLMAMLSHLAEAPAPLGFSVKVLYSARDPGVGRSAREILFLPRLAEVVERLGDFDALELFLTPGEGEGNDGMAVIGGEDGEILYRGRRIRGEDLERVLGPVEERVGTVVYVCGVPGMTEKLVRRAKKAEGMDERHVLHEKWW
jgi:ferredoxin-NADP reductase